MKRYVVLFVLGYLATAVVALQAYFQWQNSIEDAMASSASFDRCLQGAAEIEQFNKQNDLSEIVRTSHYQPGDDFLQLTEAVDLKVPSVSKSTSRNSRIDSTGFEQVNIDPTIKASLTLRKFTELITLLINSEAHFQIRSINLRSKPKNQVQSIDDEIWDVEVQVYYWQDASDQ
jgi:hypothetical protein